ncbi:hypothetical protein AX016_1162 [Cellulophaga sp. RHA19]|nr:hypothetical protein [Cellulophaga sp. RHA19]PKB42982.1 hypothetical protein AX016_1162 [Cellulophaga sp. RHA19]
MKLEVFTASLNTYNSIILRHFTQNLCFPVFVNEINKYRKHITI